MAIRIPRAKQPQTVEAPRGRAIEQDRSSGLQQVAKSLQQLGTGLRDAQAKMDIAESETRIYAAERMARQHAEEKGLYGEDYAGFMKEAVGKAREEVSGMTKLPEVKRYLSDKGMVDQEAASIKFEAEGRRKQLANAQKRYENNMEVLGKAAQHEFFMERGQIKQDLLDLMDNASMTAEAIPFQAEDERKKQMLDASSAVGFQAGLEIIEGYTRNGEGDPMALLSILIDENGDIAKNDYTQGMTSDHVWRLKQLAEQKLEVSAGNAATMSENASQRIREIKEQVSLAIKEGREVPDSTWAELEKSKAVLRRLGSDERIMQNPYIGKYAPAMESDRQTLFLAQELETTMSVYENSEGMTRQQLSLLRDNARIALRNGQWPESMKDMEDLEKVIDLGDPNREKVYTGESQAVQAFIDGLDARLARLDKAEKDGTLTTEVAAGFDLVDLNSATGGYLRIDEEGVQPGAPYTAEDIAIMSQPIEWSDWNGAQEIIRRRQPAVGVTGTKTGLKTTLINKEEANAFNEAVRRGELQPRQVVEVFGSMVDMRGDALRQQLSFFGDSEKAGAIIEYTMEKGMRAAAEAVASGMIVSSREDFSDNTFFMQGESNALEAGIREYVGNSFGVHADEAQQELLRTGINFAYIGSMKKATENDYDETQLKNVISGMFVNGATFDTSTQRIYPQARDSVEGVVDIQEAMDQLAEEDFGAVFPEFPLEDDVLDWAAGQTGTERVIEMIQDGEAALVPLLDRPGAYTVRFSDEVMLPDDAGLYNGARVMVGKDGAPFVMDFTDYYANRPQVDDRMERVEEQQQLDDIRYNRR